jgi:3-dehydroquinate synthase
MEYSNDTTRIIFTRSAGEELASRMTGFREGRVFMATEATVERLWLRDHPVFGALPAVVLPAGEEHKQLSSVTRIWEFLSQSGADRKSLLVNVGGGMLTDLAGFAASTFKRGIPFIHIPTTLLAQVDASVGGKTGFNFLGLKNEIGTFAEPQAVIIDTRFLETLDRENFLSGYAEMIKHGLIADPGHLQELEAYLQGEADPDALAQIIRSSVAIKQRFVEQDPREAGIRKALNFGHTTGHAIESLAMETGRPLLHGYAVAWGMIAELRLSVSQCGFPENEALRLASWIRKQYGKLPLTPAHFDPLYALMGHDKKNASGRINFTLLSAPGKIETDRNATREEIMDSLAFLSQL